MGAPTGPYLVLGATGGLGQAIGAALAARDMPVSGAARTGADQCFDVADEGALRAALTEVDPAVVINCAAIVDHAACAADPGRAYEVNAAPVAVLAAWSQHTGRPLVQISTDQFFANAAGPIAHKEDAPVTVVGPYAQTKYAGEGFARTAPEALIVRTNMTPARSGRGKKSVVEWAFTACATRSPMTLYTDYYCSTIDAPALAEAVLDLLNARARGLINVAARDVFSKAEFIRALAAAAQVELDWAEEGSASGLEPPRTLAAGLDVTRAEDLLDRRLPTLDEVAANFADQFILEPEL